MLNYPDDVYGYGIDKGGVYFVGKYGKRILTGNLIKIICYVIIKNSIYAHTKHRTFQSSLRLSNGNRGDG